MDREFERRYAEEQLKKAISVAGLRNSEYRALVMIYGLFGHTPHTEKELAKLLGVTYQYIHGLHKWGLYRLRRYRSCKYLEGLLED